MRSAFIAASAVGIATLALPASGAPVPPGSGSVASSGPSSPAGSSVTPPATPQQIALARAEADTILARAGAQDLFDNVTSTANPALRHKASGLICGFNAGSPINKVFVFHSALGDGIGCNTARDQRSFSLFLDPAPPQPPPIGQLVAALGLAIVKRFPDAKPSPSVMTASGKDADGSPLPPHRAVVYIRQGPSGLIVEREVAGYIGGWVLQQRITEPEAQSVAFDLLNELSFISDERAILQAAKERPIPGSPT